MLIHFLIKTIYIYLIGFFLAILEIQIEGEHGWAENLPTWRAKPGSWPDKFFKKLMSEKDLTGYHTVLMVFLLLFFHLPFIWFSQWNLWSELELLSFFVLFATVWDFLWFVLNPKFSLRAFGPERVWWHKKWWWKFPRDYYFSIVGSLALLLPEAYVLGASGWYKMAILLGVNLILTAVAVRIYPKTY